MRLAALEVASQQTAAQLTTTARQLDKLQARVRVAGCASYTYFDRTKPCRTCMHKQTKTTSTCRPLEQPKQTSG